MRHRLRGARFASAIAALIITLQLGVMPTASEAQAPRGQGRRTANRT